MNPITKAIALEMLPSSEILSTQDLLKRSQKSDYIVRLLWNALPYSHYGYGIYHAARLAKLLKLPAISVIEFGVAGGNGLVAMEEHAKVIQKLTKVKIQIYGFDTGQGMTPPADYRDMPYRFAPGNYKMDIPKLRARLKKAKLVLGDVRETAASFFETHKPAPIGFASFDMDYYSSTMHAFQLFADGLNDDFFLPRIQCYFDDIIGHEISSYNDFVGELAAIRDFNHASQHVKVAESRVFRKYAVNFEWYHQFYVMHRFTHKLYNTYISSAKPSSLALTKKKKKKKK